MEKFLLKDGLKDTTDIQCVDGIKIYPKDYFCPINFLNGKVEFTSNTVAVHHYAASWWTDQDKKYHKIGQNIGSIFGEK